MAVSREDRRWQDRRPRRLRWEPRWMAHHQPAMAGRPGCVSKHCTYHIVVSVVHKELVCVVFHPWGRSLPSYQPGSRPLNQQEGLAPVFQPKQRKELYIHSMKMEVGHPMA